MDAARPLVMIVNLLSQPVAAPGRLRRMQRALRLVSILTFAASCPRVVLADTIHIPPAMAPAVERLFAGPETLGTCRLGDVEIQDTQIAVHLQCPNTPTDAVVSVLPLADVGPGNRIAVTASFSLWLDHDSAADPHAAAQLLGDRLRSHDDGQFFAQARALQPHPPRPKHQAQARPAPERPHVAWLLLLWFALSVTLGAVVGAGVIRRLRRPLRTPTWLLGSLLLLAVPVVLAAVGLRLPVGFQDQEAVLLLAALTARWLAEPRRPMAWFISGMTFALALVLAEAAARMWLAEPPTFPDAQDVHLTADAHQLDFGCQALFDPEPPSPPRHDPELLARPRRVLHIGDSMVAGNDLKNQQANFTALLDRRYPDVWNVNAGDPGTTMDTHLLWLRKHLAQVKPELVVVYALVVNDVAEMDRPYVCCDMGPLLEYTPEGPVSRCPVEKVREPLLFFIAYSPAPYPLRVAASVSYLARHALAALTQGSATLANTFFRRPADTDVGTEEQWRHFELALAAMKREVTSAHASLVLVVLPSRRALASADPEHTLGFATQQRMLHVGQAAGIRTLDAWPVFADVVRTAGAGAWFVDPPAWNCHFNAAGHARLAQWLADTLFSQP